MSAAYHWDSQDAILVKDGFPLWYVSPDIWIGEPRDSVARAGDNDLHVRIHQVSGTSFDEPNVELRVYVANPALLVSPRSSVRIARTLVDKDLLATGVHLVDAVWPVDHPDDHPDRPADHPLNPGHRTLVVRAFPGPVTENLLPREFDVLGDQHEAQRNIVIATASDNGAGAGGAGFGLVGVPGEDPLGPGPDGLTTFFVDTIKPNGDEDDETTLRARPVDTLPDSVFDEVEPQLTDAGFESFAMDPPEMPDLDFELETAELPQPWEPGSLIDDSAREVDVGAAGDAPDTDVGEVEVPERALAELGRPMFEHYRPRLVADRSDGGRRIRDCVLLLEPDRRARFAFKVDMRGVPVGQTRVYALEQIRQDGTVVGGLQVVLVKVR